MPDADIKTQTMDTGGANVRCSMWAYRRHSCCRCISACKFIHGHSFSNSSLVKLTVKEWIKYSI